MLYLCVSFQRPTERPWYCLEVLSSTRCTPIRYSTVFSWQRSSSSEICRAPAVSAVPRASRLRGWTSARQPPTTSICNRHRATQAPTATLSIRHAGKWVKVGIGKMYAEISEVVRLRILRRRVCTFEGKKLWVKRCGAGGGSARQGHFVRYRS